MNKPIIAIDFDDVLAETYAPFIEFYNSRYEVDVPLEMAPSIDTEVWKIARVDVLRERINSYLMSAEYRDLPIKLGAADALKRLTEKYELHIVTGRNDDLTKATYDAVEKHYPGVFQSIEFTNFLTENSPRTKLEVCLKIGATILIDDHLHHAEEVAAGGIEVLLFGDYAWNQTDVLPEGVRRVQNWTEVVDILLS